MKEDINFKEKSDLLELFLIIWEKKSFIIFFTSIITVLGMIYIFFKTPIYEAKGLFKIGNYKSSSENNITLIEDAFAMTEELNIIISRSFKNESIATINNQNKIIEIKSLSTSSPEAINKVKKRADIIQERHKNILNSIKEEREILIKSINKKISQKKNEVFLFDKKIKFKNNILENYLFQLKQINKEIDKNLKLNPTLVSLKLNEKLNISTLKFDLTEQIINMEIRKDNIVRLEINDLIEKKEFLERQNQDRNYQQSEVIGEIVVNKNIFKKNAFVIFFTSFLLSIFLILFMNFTSNRK